MTFGEGISNMEITYKMNDRQYALLIQQQRPWHSIIRLPPRVSTRGLNRGDAPRTQDAGLVEISNHGVDELIIMIRMLLGIGFRVRPEDRRSPLITCANHNFGWDPTPDFEAKGLLLAALYPDWDAERFKSEHLTLSALLGHEEVRRVIFGSPLFWLVHPQVLTFDDQSPEEPAGFRELSLDEIVTKSDLLWDGRRPLSTWIVESIFPDSRKPKGLPAVYSALPDFIRVRLRPSAITDHTNFDGLRRLRMEVPIVVDAADGSVTNDWATPIYTLRAIIRFARDEADRASEPDIRIYDIEGDPVPIMKTCDLSCGSLADEKIKPHSKWEVGEPDFQYQLVYSRIDGPRNPFPPPPRGTVGQMLPEEQLGPHISTKYIKKPAPRSRQSPARPPPRPPRKDRGYEMPSFDPRARQGGNKGDEDEQPGSGHGPAEGTTRRKHETEERGVILTILAREGMKVDVAVPHRRYHFIMPDLPAAPPPDAPPIDALLLAALLLAALLLAAVPRLLLGGSGKVEQGAALLVMEIVRHAEMHPRRAPARGRPQRIARNAEGGLRPPRPAHHAAEIGLGARTPREYAGVPPGDRGRRPARPSSSETISDSEPESTALELEFQKENEALREQLEQFRLSNQEEMARREIVPGSQPARAAEELERQKAELAARNAQCPVAGTLNQLQILMHILVRDNRHARYEHGNGWNWYSTVISSV
ncbi:hypothetical protein DL768_007568 [Monosporascus sp. mg162]|nr:hypothetical protein DL768_007568 [Monosporascus sp. mg162]